MYINDNQLFTSFITLVILGLRRQWHQAENPPFALTNAPLNLALFLWQSDFIEDVKDQSAPVSSVADPCYRASHPLQVRGKRHRDSLRSRPRLELLKLPLRITIVAYQPCLLISLCTPLRRRMVSRRPLPWRNWRCRTRLKRLTLARMSRKRSRSSISLSQWSTRFKSMC